MLPLLENGFGPFPGYTMGDYDAANNAYDSYNNRIEALLDAHQPTLYPELDLLDSMFTSIEIKPEKVSWEIPPDVCRDNWSRLMPGMKAVAIAPFDEVLRIRMEPSTTATNNEVLKKGAGNEVEILEGPVCAEG